MGQAEAQLHRSREREILYEKKKRRRRKRTMMIMMKCNIQHHQ
jgi:predicted nucleic acid-binding Zn ribbon protein